MEHVKMYPALQAVMMLVCLSLVWGTPLPFLAVQAALRTCCMAEHGTSELWQAWPQRRASQPTTRQSCLGGVGAIEGSRAAPRY